MLEHWSLLKLGPGHQTDLLPNPERPSTPNSLGSSCSDGGESLSENDRSSPSSPSISGVQLMGLVTGAHQIYDEGTSVMLSPVLHKPTVGSQ